MLFRSQVVTTSDIRSWKNADKLPVFVTATCEFSRFDNPERYTAGEMLINQPEGGAIALYSTTRLAFAGLNIQLNKSFFQHLMDKDSLGQHIKMGDLIRLSKNDNKNNYQLRNFVLLGDPAQSIAFPDYVVTTKTINGKKAIYPDSVSGLSTVLVKGQVEDVMGNKVSNFNGKVSCKVFDKSVTYSTLGNRQKDGVNYPAPFKMQNSLLFSGSVKVDSGDYEFSFAVPKSISLQNGPGKISYYAVSDGHDASGYCDKIIIGGRNPQVNPENDGPEIGLFLNSIGFKSGDQVNSAPELIANLADTNGINWLGLGIGHEIEVVVDNDRAHAIVVNDYFQPQFGTYTRGTVYYPLSGLLAGNHTLSLRAWDLFDNSSVKEISFTIPELPPLKITNVITVPNPMSESAKFTFKLNQDLPDGLDLTIRIYNLQGVLLRTLNASWSSVQAEMPFVNWDGTDGSGKKLKSGLYPYEVIFTAKDGTYYRTSQKLMIIN